MIARESVKYLKLICLFSFLALSISCLANATGDDSYLPKPIGDVHTVRALDGNDAIDSTVSINYSIFYQADKSGVPSSATWSHQDPHYLSGIIVQSSNDILRFAKMNGMSTVDWKGSEYNINVFSISRQVMSQRNRFSSFSKSVDLPFEIWGFYDPTIGVRNNSAIMISNIDNYTNSVNLNHEMAHYWWDRVCLKSKWRGNSESFAQAYEAYHVRSIR